MNILNNVGKERKFVTYCDFNVFATLYYFQLQMSNISNEL